MAAAVPLAKLGGLVLKALSKPLSKSLKSQASNHPTLKVVLIHLGNLSHKMTARLSIWSSGFKVKKVGNLEAEKALQRGSDIFGESIVLTVGCGVAIYEYNSSAAKNRAKEAKKMASLRAADIELKTELRVLRSRIEALEDASWGRTKQVDRSEVEEQVRMEVEGGINPGVAASSVSDSPSVGGVSKRSTKDEGGDDDDGKGGNDGSNAELKRRATERNEILKVWKKFVNDKIDGRRGDGDGR